MNNKPAKPDPLRAAAEEQLAHVPEAKVKLRTSEDLLHELQVYQIELEMQNETLRQAQVALEESRDRYVNLYEFAPVGYLTLTDNGMISEINLTGSSLFKVERSKLLHKRFIAFVAPEYRDYWNILFVSVLQESGARNCELALENGAGESFHAYLDCMCLVTDDKPPVVRVTFSDITYWRQAEESMREWQTFVERATWGMSIGDIESRTIKLANPAYARMHGYTVEELRNIKADIMYAPESRANLPHYVACVREDGHHTFGCVRQRKDGSTFLAEVDVSIVEGIGGKATTIVSVQDITERKLAELQLMESEQQYRTLADSGQALIWASDTDKLCNYFNQTWLQFTGRTLEQEFGNGWAEGVHPDDFQRCLEVYVSAFERREKFSVDYRLRHRDGEYRWIQDDGCPRYNSKGEFIGYIGYCLDITGRKQVEQQLRDLSLHLHTVREEEKHSIAREIHDDLGSTLTALKMESYLLAEELPAHKDASLLLEHVESMAQLIDTAVHVTRRVITGLRPTILDDFGLLAALEWQAAQFQKRTGIECRVNCGGTGDCEKKLDKAQLINLFRIFQEALTNVSRHSGASKVQVDFHHGDEEVMLSISDNGCGMPETGVVAQNSYGLRGMRERVAQLGGMIEFSKPPGGGLELTVILSSGNGGKS